MTKAIVVSEPGPARALQWRDVAVGRPRAGEALVRHTAVGLNYIDVYHRSGLYKLPLPFTPGTEGAGVVEAVGRGVSHVKPGDRVAYASGPVGAYSESRVMPAQWLVKLPAAVSDQQAAAMMLQGMTAQYLLRQVYRVKKGETVLIHAAAGGVGLIACQWAKHLGATVIGTVGSKDKADLAAAHGCDYPIIYTRQNFVDRVRRITKGDGVPVVYDSVGKDTFDGSLDCLRRRGMMVSFGNASGAIPPFNVLTLSAKGSLYLTRPTLVNFIDTPESLKRTANDLFRVVRSGAVKIEINQTYPLKDAAKAHRDLEARKTTGSSVLLV